MASIVFDVVTAQPGVWLAQWTPPSPSDVLPVTGSGLTEAAALADLHARIAERFGIAASSVQLRKVRSR